MVYNVYSILDDKTCWMAPTLDSNDGSALRHFRHAVITSTDVLGTSAGDFRLFRIAAFNADNGQLLPESTPVFIARGSDFVEMDKAGDRA